MSPYAYDEQGRRVMAPTKGELREKVILDEAEKQLIAVGPDAMTVETIATAAGLTRGALYFYFRSKNDVLAALVQRIVVELSGAVATRGTVIPGSPREALLSAIDLTEDLWQRHGAVMRAAVDLSPSVPVIAQLWNGARDDITRSVRAIVASDDEPADAADGQGDLVPMLVGMTERAFYDASVAGTPVAEATPAITTIWLRALRLDA
ncbi:TetR/AcrR family transcriptional regulator [Glaciihabitans sp. dw_435]|uniref:TetR/AcrR family transcriptional regulator n=1 Tax=Glaciihabitans sp. dw_435 TaxID=2720081 RepID=UPI001BD2701B|nr:TetR/AcrR family transcriptional regulator [Glaciihabitans sp. dw_435]